VTALSVEWRHHDDVLAVADRRRIERAERVFIHVVAPVSLLFFQDERDSRMSSEISKFA